LVIIGLLPPHLLFLSTTLKTETNIYVMEFKMGTSDEALLQIEERKYYEKYLSSGKTIQLIGVGFDREEKNISDYKVYKLPLV
jgi:hypothetical protein